MQELALTSLGKLFVTVKSQFPYSSNEDDNLRVGSLLYNRVYIYLLYIITLLYHTVSFASSRLIIGKIKN